MLAPPDAQRSGVVILVEGPSDAAVIETLAVRLGLRDERVTVVAMGGVTNIRSYLRTITTGNRDVIVSGLCDSGEERYVVRALRELGHQIESRADMVCVGFFVCEADLEEELIRALGAAHVEAVIGREGESDRLHLFRAQPAQRDRSIVDQLHRFSGTRSGRKVRLAGALAGELDLATLPTPLKGVLEFAYAAAR